jgi:hypothetical protein
MQHVRRARQGLGIREAQWSDRVEHARRHAKGARLARLHGQSGGAELRELLDDIAVQALTDRCEQHHGRYTDADAERGQHAPHAVRRDRLAD